MNSPTLAAPSPPLADLSLNWVIRRASPKPVRHCSTQPSWACAGHLALHEDRRALGVDAHRHQLGGGAQGALAEHLRVLLDGDRVQVGDEEERLVLALQVDPLPQRPEVVAEVERVGRRLDAGQHPGTGARGDLGDASAPVTWSRWAWRALCQAPIGLPVGGRLGRVPHVRSPDPHRRHRHAPRPPATTTSWASYEQCQDPLSIRLDDGADRLRAATTAVRFVTRGDARAAGRTAARGGSRSRPRGGTPAPWSCATRAAAGPRSRSARTRGCAAPAPWSAPCRLLLDWGFAEQGVRTVVWHAHVGNWASRRLAWRLGFSFDGTAARLPAASAASSSTPGSGTLLATDDRCTADGRGWRCRCSRPTVLRLRPLGVESDVRRIVEACGDERTQRWLGRMPDAVHRRPTPRAWLEHQPRDGRGDGRSHWAVADPDDDVLLGVGQRSSTSCPRPRAEIGYWAHPDARGRGVDRPGPSALALRHGFETLGLVLIQGHAALGNAASRHVIEANGLRGGRRGAARHGRPPGGPRRRRLVRRAGRGVASVSRRDAPWDFGLIQRLGTMAQGTTTRGMGEPARAPSRRCARGGC